MSLSVGAEAWEDNENPPNFLGSVEKAAEYLVELADRQPGESVKTAIYNAAKRSGLSHTRASDIWYRKARRIEQFEQDIIAAALLKHRRISARNEFQELRTRLSRLEAMLAQSDPDFHRDTIGQVKGQLRDR